MCLIVMVLSISVVHAQQFSLGVRAGGMLTWPGFSDSDVKDSFGRKIKHGFNVGLLVGFPLKNNYEVIVEGGASQRGRILTFNDKTWENHLTMQMTDMSMLLRKSFKITVRKNIPIQVFINGGPEINYWFRSVNGFLQVDGGKKFEYEIHHGENPPQDGVRYMTLKNINTWLFSFSLGTGIKAPLRNNRYITTELRFISGHTFMGKKDSAFINGMLWGSGNMQDTFETNLKTLSLSIAYTINIDVKESRKGKSTIKDPSKRRR